MTALITAAIVVGYMGTSLFWMRHLYGRWRAKSIDGYTGLGVQHFERVDRGLFMTLAALAGLLWPFSLPTLGTAMLLTRWMATTSVKSQLEQRAERDELRKRIGELERDLGIGGQR